MGLEVTLLGVVTSIVVWVVQRENGGILNAVLDPEHLLPNITKFDLKNNPEQGVLDYVTSMLLHQPIPLNVLEAIPESLGGGKAGVDASRALPNREPAMFWVTISIFLVMLVLIVIVQIVNGCCCCCRERDDGVSFTGLIMCIMNGLLCLIFLREIPNFGDPSVHSCRLREPTAI